MDLAVIQSALIISLLIYDSAKDIKYREIPNEISAAIALAMVLDFNVQNLWGLAAAAVFFITALFTEKIGGGDVKLIIALSVVCGLWGTVFLLFSAQLSMLAFYAAYAVILKIKGKKAGKSLPFVPFITFGYILLKIFF